MIVPPKILFKSCTHTICCHVKGLQDLNNTSRRPKHKIKAFFVPSDWNHTKLYHDIALVFVAPSINLTGTDIGSIVLDDTDPEGFKLPSIIIKETLKSHRKSFPPLSIYYCFQNTHHYYIFFFWSSWNKMYYDWLGRYAWKSNFFPKTSRSRSTNKKFDRMSKKLCITWSKDGHGSRP